MEITVDRDLCEANAICCGLEPAVFRLDDDENLVILEPDTDRLSAEQVARVSKALERCPKNALRMVDHTVDVHA